MVNELFEDVVHFFVVDFEFTVELLGRVLELIAVKSCSNFSTVVSDTSDRDLLGDIQVHEFVRNDVHPLEGESLGASSGETFKDPTLASLLSLLNFLLNSFNNDLVVHILELH